MITITDEDIEFAEELLLPIGKKFDDERRAVIKCLKPMDIHACPGSGKTTALLAKLIILSRNLPLNDNRGICVLTHTNVAIDEVENRVGIKAQNLLNYPNFFGTIQSFVDKYLAIPAYIESYGKRPHRIDNEVYFDMVERTYKTMSWGARSYIERKREFMTWLKNIRFDLEHGYLISGLEGERLFKDDNGNIASQIKRFKYEIMKKGYLCFDDAYYLSFQYLKKYGEVIKNTLSERFAYIFIDEMQDTDTHQLTLLDKIFDSLKTIAIQKIGDPNQAIYSDSSKNEDEVWKICDGSLCIVGSKRFSNAIANIVSNLCSVPQKIAGNPDIPDISPKIIVFDDASINKVLNCFGDLIYKHGLNQSTKAVFKAVGWIGKIKDSRTLASYWTGYKRIIHNKKTEYSCLRDYLQKSDENTINLQGANYYRKNIIRAFVKILKILGKKESEHAYFTESTINKYLYNSHRNCYDKLQSSLATWCIQLQNDIDVTNGVKDFIINDFKAAFALNSLSPIKEFLDTNSNIYCEQNKELEVQNSGVYKFSKNGTNINIEIATVHSVKGETHTATLYLETYYNKKYDIERIMSYLTKTDHTKKTKKVGKEEMKALKIAYVGMSRPSHLLCLAAHKDNIQTHEEDLVANGWEIVKIFDTV